MKLWLLFEYHANVFLILIAGQVARYQYECMRREAASVKIQKHYRMCLARNTYQKLYSSAVLIQACMRGMDTRNELKFRKQTRAAIIIQVKDSMTKRK